MHAAMAATPSIAGGISNSPPKPHFDPVVFGLDINFRLTELGESIENNYKIPRETLNSLLEGLDKEEGVTNSLLLLPPAVLGIGSDCSVTSFRHSSLYLVQTTDFLYPICDDPYIMGRIACANVLSDMYAMGVVDCDNILMILGVSNKLKHNERDVVVPLILKGFKDCANVGGCHVTGGHTIVNPWMIIGGVATSGCRVNDFILPDNAVPGDVLVLTKPMGSILAMNAMKWSNDPVKWNRLRIVVSENDIKKGYHRAIDNMTRLNKAAAVLMHKYSAHAATDISGYGLVGHARNLARMQLNDVSLMLHNLPIIAKMSSVAKAMKIASLLQQGELPEVSGGLLICFPRQQAMEFCAELAAIEGYTAWIVGLVESGNRTATVIDKPRIIEVPLVDKPGQLW